MTIYYPTTKNFTQKTLDAALLSGTTASMTLNNVTGIQNKPGVCIVDRINTNGTETVSKREVIVYTGVSGSTLTGLTRNADSSGTDQEHGIGAIVEFSADVIWAQGIIDALLHPVPELITTAGGTTTYTLTPSPAITAYTTGQEFLIKMNATNTGASTINVSGLGAKSLTKGGATALASSDLLINAVYKIVYDGTQFQVSGIGGSSATVATQAEVATGTDNTKMVTPLAVSRWHMPPQGFLYNGKIVPSVSGGALTVALKTLAGTDPSASDPVYVRIGDAIRSITSALSVTINGGTNWFGIGTAGLAGNETDLFSFIGLKSSDSSYRLMVGRLGIDGQLNQTGYADGDGTANTYIYPYSQIAATDSIALIGRFAATLSAGSGYTWSVPSYTSSNLIQRPVYETRPLSYTPQIGDGSLGNGSISGTYQIMGTRVRVRGKFTLGSTSTVTGNLNFSKPIQTASESTDIGVALAWDNSATVRYISFTTLVAGNIYPHTGTGSYGYYSSTAPMTWATSDTATFDITYWVV